MLVTEARMLRELAEALEVMTTARPLVLVLEDLHWSDPSTLAFLAYVARHRDRARLLVLGTYRPAHVLVPAHLSALMTQHIEQLSPADQVLLEAASVAGMTFSVAAMAATVDLALPSIETRCATWARQGWFVHELGIER